jgi:hypothetical protein
MARSPLLLLVFVATVLAGLRAGGGAVDPAKGADGSGDIEAFQAVIARVRAGESYYPAFGDEMRRRGYPLRQVFNWRTPLLMVTAASVPETALRGLLIGLGLALCVATLTTLHPVLTGVAAVTMQLGTFLMIAVPGGAVMGEPWAGVCIGLSVCAYLAGRRRVGVALGLLALFVRELAAPFCITCAAIALVQRRWREAGGWIAGGCLYAAYFAWHVASLSAQQQPGDLTHGGSWLQFGGIDFLMGTLRWQAWLLNLPIGAGAAALGLIVAAIAAEGVPAHVRVSSAVYVLLFLIAGHRFNGYWGLVAWPAWALACGFGVQALYESGVAARRRAIEAWR